MSADIKSSNERRRSVRVQKTFIIRFCAKNDPSQKYEISQIKNISRTGICFTSTKPLAQGVIMLIEFRMPYVSDMISLEAQVLDSKEKVKNVVYENRLKYQNVSLEALIVLEKIENYNNQVS